MIAQSIKAQKIEAENKGDKLSVIDNPSAIKSFSIINLNELARVLAGKFAEDNANFDSKRFINACGFVD